ncbi:MAG: DUF2807 domain-containing protein [Treponema sp.]|nr:DUF2807 domain-containing protein [Treponema sp.]
MKIKSIFYLLVISAAMLFTGCVLVNIGDLSTASTIQAKGEREIYNIKTGNFNKIKIEGICEVRYYAGSSDTVKFEVPPNVREQYEVLVENGELIIRSANRISYNNKNSPILTVNVSALESVTLEGAGEFIAYDKITADNLSLITLGAGSVKAELDVNSLSINLSGASDMKLSGRADTASLNLTGAGDISALSLQTNTAEIFMSGAGSIKISCAQTLNINASGAGSIEYSGSPRISQNTGGFVSIKQIK